MNRAMERAVYDILDSEGLDSKAKGRVWAQLSEESYRRAQMMTQFFYTTANGVDAVCGVEIYGDVVVCNEFVASGSVGITNNIELIAEKVCEKYGINTHTLRFIIHTATGYHEVSFVPQLLAGSHRLFNGTTASISESELAAKYKLPY